MKITQISRIDTNYRNNTRSLNKNYTTNNIQTTANMQTLPNYGYGRDLVTKNVSFKGNVAKEAIDFALLLPVEERLAEVLSSLKYGELVLLGKDFKNAQQALKSNISSLKQVIKKEIYMPDKVLENNYAFIKNEHGEAEIFNINQEQVTYITGGEKYSLPQGSSYYLLPNDTIQYGNDVIPVIDKPKTDLSNFKKFFTKVYDFSDDVQKEVARMNIKTIGKNIIKLGKPTHRVDFSCIGGQPAAIKELKQSILYPIKCPDGFSGEDISRGFILHGPAGTGKTELCRALANEADVNFVYMSGTDFESKWVGESEENVRNFFEKLKENQPAIGVIDEIDAIAKERNGQDVYGDKVVNQILTSMTDLYNENDDVFVLGLTNKYDSLDGALKRAERFSKHIFIGKPDRDGVKDILKIHTKDRALDENLDLDKLSDKLYSIEVVGADIKLITKLARESMMNRLGIYEKMENGTFSKADMTNAKITQDDFENAIKEFSAQHRTAKRAPIGFNKN
jgi:ATP-dependent 26S proteasome regulatory subunit